MEENVQKKKFSFKGIIDSIKNIEWKKTVKPVIAYSVFGGTVALAVLLGVLIICL